jgi:hypothetical protein
MQARVSWTADESERPMQQEMIMWEHAESLGGSAKQGLEMHFRSVVGCPLAMQKLTTSIQVLQQQRCMGKPHSCA